MSLLNRMLQDLDARQEGGRAAARLHDDVRPLPPAVMSHWPKRVATFAVVGAIVVGVAYVYWPVSVIEGVESAATTGVVAPPVPREPVLPPDPATVSVIVPSATLPEPATGPVADDPVSLARLDGGSLRLSDALFMPVGKKAPAKTGAGLPVTSAAVGSQPVEAPRRKTLDGEKLRASEPSPAPSLEVPRAGKGPAIEKTDAVGTPRERAESDYRKAIAVVNQGRMVEAIETLQGALRHDGAHVPARQLLIKLLFEARRADEAMQMLRDGLQILPTQSAWAMALARLQVDRGDLPGAAQTLERSLPSGAASADYQGFAGHVAYRLGRHREAVDHYQVATRLVPSDGRWWLGLGLAYDAEGRVNEAREALLRAKASGTLSAELLAVAEQKLR